MRGDFEKDQILCFGFDRQLSLMLRNPVLDETDYWGKVNHSDCMKMTQDRRTMSASVKEEAVMKQVSRRRASVGPKCTFRIGKTTAGVGKKSVFYPKGEISSYGSGRRGRLLAATWGICNNNICTRRAGKLYRARSRLYRSQILQVNSRWRALAEIYRMHSFAPLSSLIFFVKNC